MDWKLIGIFALICVGHGQDVKVEGHDDNSVSTPSKENSIANAINNFGYKLLLTMMEKDKDKNVIISPISIAGILAMALAGTVGKTYDELAAVLGFSQDVLENRYNHEVFGELLKALNTGEDGSKTIYADAIYVDEHTTLRDLFKDYMKRIYDGEITNVNFGEAETAKNIINDWVSNHTLGKIDNFLQEPLPPATKVVLLTALYFKGQWERPFVVKYTKEMPFYTPTKEISVPQMLHAGMFDYVYSKQYDMQMIAFPYNDSDTTMYVLKPRVPERQTLLELMRRLDHAKLEQLLTELSSERSIVRFPKIDLESKVYLRDSLQALGVKSMFSAVDANFGLMVDAGNIKNNTEMVIAARLKNHQTYADVLQGLDNPRIYVDSILHDVKLTINEYGTEAVAATAGILPKSVNLFFVNSPYHIFIRNKKTKLITFSASIFDPSQK